MFRYKNMQEASFRVPDDKPLFAIYKDFSAGINERVHARDVQPNQGTQLENVDLGTPASLLKRPGTILIGNDIGSDTPETLHNFEIQGATDQLVMYEDQRMWKWEGAGNWAALSLVTLFTASTDVGIISAKESGLAPDDVMIIQNDQDNAKRIDYDGNIQDLGSVAGTGSDSPPKSSVMAWYANRVWVLKDDQLFFSAAYSADYSSGFDTVSDVFRIPVGDERGIAVTRNLGMVILGVKGVWALFPSATPAVTDRPEPLVSDVGCVSKKGWAVVGDDIYFFSQDGLRTLKRTVQDQLQLGADYPVSYVLKDQFDGISWAYIENLSMQYFDNKLFISVPTGAATFNTWIYFPATNGFALMTGVNPTCWAKYKVSGEEQVFYGKQGDGEVYRAWYGYSDEGTTTTNGTAVSAIVETRAEDFGQPLVWKTGGEVEVEAAAVGGTDTIVVEARADEGAYTTLGTISLASDAAPTLPVALPFVLTDQFIVRGKLHLDSLGRYRTVQIRLTSATGNTEDIRIYNVNLVAFPEEYRNE